jgi:hypothetical protein
MMEKIHMVERNARDRDHRPTVGAAFMFSSKSGFFQ